MLSFNFVSVTTKQLAQPGDRQHAKRTPNLRTGLKGKGLYSQIKPEFIKQSSESLETRTKRIQPVGPRTPLPEPLTSCVNSANKQEMRNRRNKTQKGQKVTKLSEKRDLPPNSTRSVFGSMFGSVFGPCSVRVRSTTAALCSAPLAPRIYSVAAPAVCHYFWKSDTETSSKHPELLSVAPACPAVMHRWSCSTLSFPPRVSLDASLQLGHDVTSLNFSRPNKQTNWVNDKSLQLSLVRSDVIFNSAGGKLGNLILTVCLYSVAASHALTPQSSCSGADVEEDFPTRNGNVTGVRQNKSAVMNPDQNMVSPRPDNVTVLHLKVLN
ncbi:uncharacterized protein LOC119033857 [Acanthopagrus latus]|uniref:uncharacterized protein LOC119033857 n=1 Tax=Acanthopagrus latus TaxID=8177 RepID=UPI00187C6052|nr:uncharacterized protein LOC119033857 [Acanthopagrus latus]